MYDVSPWIESLPSSLKRSLVLNSECGTKFYFSGTNCINKS